MKKELDQETLKQIQELQFFEQGVQNLGIQRQTFQLEKNETENALEETKNAKDEVYKIVGQIMIKSSKSSIEKDLKHKKDILDLRIKSIEKQEEDLKSQLLKKREEVMKKLK